MAKEKMECPGMNTLEAYVGGDNESVDNEHFNRRSVANHIRWCEDCAIIVADMMDTLREAEEEVVGDYYGEE